MCRSLEQSDNFSSRQVLLLSYIHVTLFYVLQLSIVHFNNFNKIFPPIFQQKYLITSYSPTLEFPLDSTRNKICVISAYRFFRWCALTRENGPSYGSSIMFMHFLYPVLTPFTKIYEIDYFIIINKFAH